MKILPITLTLLAGIFIVIGSFIVLLARNNKKIVNFSIAMAFSVMILLVLFELFPEAIEHINLFDNKLLNVGLITLFAGLGFLLLKILDLFVPDHHDHEHPHKDKENNLYHIGLVSSIALSLHNIIEGMAIYIAASSSINLGILIALGVGIHNIPLGMVMASAFYKANKNIKKTLFICLLIAVSTVMGGILASVINNFINELFLGIMLSITLGMLVYITVFELFPQIYHDKKRSIFGLITGVGIFILSLLFHSH